MRLAKLIVLGLLVFPSLVHALAFPTAVGAGKDTAGGRGGQVITVTNLNDSGPGSFRAAVLTQGPRIIVFAVSGDIRLTTKLYMTSPYVTIAGQTSPGGISISGKTFFISTHDVIMRHMRFRGAHSLYDPNDNDDGDSLSISGRQWSGFEAYNIVVDHCSVTWGIDETFSVTGGVTKTTIQNSLIAQGVWNGGHLKGNHSKGLMVSGKRNYDTEVSLYRNFIANNYDRSPLVADELTATSFWDFTCELVNNVSYNWWHGNRPAWAGEAKVNWIANYSKAGPDSTQSTFLMESEPGAKNVPVMPLLYVSGNFGTARTVDSQPEWMVSDGYGTTALSESYRTMTRWPITNPLPVTPMTPELATQIVEGSGARTPGNPADSVDLANINSYKNNVSAYQVSVPVYPTDWPVYSTANDNPTDTDGDGMPDTWETAKGLNPSVANASVYTLDTGYTDIEVYLNEKAGDDGAIIITPGPTSQQASVNRASGRYKLR